MTFQNLQVLRLIMATHNLNQHNDNSDRRHFSNSRYIKALYIYILTEISVITILFHYFHHCAIVESKQIQAWRQAIDASTVNTIKFLTCHETCIGSVDID